MIRQPDNGYKYRQVYDRILFCLRRGEYKLGDRLPSERQLSEQLGVNIATVRRGYKDLTLAGVVEKKIGSGAYLRCPLDARPQERPLTFICSSELNLVVVSFMNMLGKIMEETGRRYRFLFDNAPDLSEHLSQNIEFAMPTISISLSDTVMQAMKKAPHLFVVMATRTNDQGIPCVLCDDIKGMRMLVEHLQQQGHRKIALAHLSPGFGQDEYQVTGWKETLGSDYEPSLLLGIPHIHHDEMDDFRDYFTKNASRRNYTALICLGDESMTGAIAGLRANGLEIPKDVAIATVGNGRLTRNLYPPITTYDPDLEGHIRYAIEMLDYNSEHCQDPRLLSLVPPKLFCRASTLSHKIK